MCKQKEHGHKKKKKALKGIIKMEHYKRDMKLTTELAELAKKQSEIVLQIQQLLLDYANDIQTELKQLTEETK